MKPLPRGVYASERKVGCGCLFIPTLLLLIELAVFTLAKSPSVHAFDRWPNLILITAIFMVLLSVPIIFFWWKGKPRSARSSGLVMLGWFLSTMAIKIGPNQDFENAVMMFMIGIALIAAGYVFDPKQVTLPVEDEE